MPGGICTGASPVVCAALNSCHVAGACDSATGACSNPILANGTACNDGDVCTKTDSCQTGTCTGGNPVICGLGTSCIAGACITPPPCTGTVGLPDVPIALVSVSPIAVVAADLNGDGKPDLVAANSNSDTVSVLLNRCLP